MFRDYAHVKIKTTGALINVRVGGGGPPLLLLHGYPQTHVMWHRVASLLSRDFTLVMADLRGYGDSNGPPGGRDHREYAKRAMAQDQVEVMAALGFHRFHLAGHDRGARVAHRLALDYADRVERMAVLDVVPTLAAFEHVDAATALGYFHWFMLAQAKPLPERLIGQDPDFWLHSRLKAWSRIPGAFSSAAVAEYLRCFRNPAVVHASCEDYRAAAGIDLVHDRADPRPVKAPLLVLWGRDGFVGRHYDVLALWRERAGDVSGHSLPCGHFLAEEAPMPTAAALLCFFHGEPLAA